MLLLSFSAALFSSRSLPKTRHAGTSSFAHRSRHLHTSARLHMQEGIPSDSGIAYDRGGSGAHLARAVKMPSRLCQLLGTARSRGQTARYALIGGIGTNPSCQALSLESRDCARKSGRARPRPCWFLLILGIDERAFWVRGWPGRLSR